MIIYLVRHGQSELNGKTIHQGQLDTKLTELGVNQAKKLALRFKDIDDFDIIYTSPLLRAKNTADEIFKFHEDKEFHEDNRLKERSHGDFTGKEYGIYDTITETDPFLKKAPNGENYYDHKIRIDEFMHDVVNSGKNCIIVSHGKTMRMILHFFEILTKDDCELSRNHWPKNTSVWKIEFQPSKVEILINNSDDHLEDDLKYDETKEMSAFEKKELD